MGTIINSVVVRPLLHFLCICACLVVVGSELSQEGQTRFIPIIGSPQSHSHADYDHSPVVQHSHEPSLSEGQDYAQPQSHISCAVIESDQHPSYHSSPPPCISTEFINAAFTEARLHYGLVQPTRFKNLEKHGDQIETLAFALLDTSRAVAHQYGLDPHQVFDLLPKLELSGTDISRFCPVPVQLHMPRKLYCRHSSYRTLSGQCNNVYRPSWGAAFTPFQNFLTPQHPDGLSEPRGHVPGHGAGSTLPSPRLVSQHIHHDTRIVHDHAITTMLIAWGQIIDHDITLTADTHDPVTFKTPECCHQPSPFHHLHHNCLPIEIPPTDPFYAHFAQPCMSFARSLAGLRPNCKLGTRKAYNRISSFLDASFVYGSSKKASLELRTGKYGLLKSHRPHVFRELGLKDLLPLKLHEPDRECIRRDDSQFCFTAGDIRVNEQLILTVLHTIFMREHNRVAKRLGGINPKWDDERLFQETRRIVIAIVQHITFNEFLPMVLGRVTMEKHGLMLATKGDFWLGYNPKIDATAAEEFVTSAFRFGHSLLPHKIERWSEGHHFIDSEDLHRLLRQPFDLFKPGRLDSYVLGLVNQLAQAMDEGVTVEVTNLLFKEPGQQFGMDLPAINIQRGREHGIPAYAFVRQFCGLSPIPDSWHSDGLLGVFPNETIHRYKDIYASPLDIDLWSGGVSEIPQHDSLLGPTFSCLIAKQFHALRAGDRFWYENPGMASSFSLDQLDEIRTVTLSRLLCDNTDQVKTVQLYAMVYPDLVNNPRVSCSGRIIPRMNLEKWREDVPQIVHPIPNHNSSHHTQSPSYHDPYLHQHEYEYELELNAIHPRHPHSHPSAYLNGLEGLQHTEHAYAYGHGHGHGSVAGSGDSLWAGIDAVAPLIPITDNHNSYDHNGDPHIDPYHYHYQQYQNGVDFNTFDGALDLQRPYTHRHQHPHPHPEHPHPDDGGNYITTEPESGMHNYHHLGANHGLYDQQQQHPHKYTQHSQHDSTVGGGGIGGVRNYESRPHNHRLTHNYQTLIESQQPHLNYGHDGAHDHHGHEHSSYFPISPILKPPQQPHHAPIKHVHEIPAPVPGSEERPIEVHQLRDLLLHQNHEQAPKSEPTRPSESEQPQKEQRAQKRNYRPKKSKRLPSPFPVSPFPGLSGVFSPNPGYLVKQKFYVPKYGRSGRWIG